MPQKDAKGRYCGVVDIEEKEKSAKFVRRYLRLDKANGLVEWFTDDPTSLESGQQPLGSIDINFITKVDIPMKVKFKAKHCFFIHTPPRRYYFQGISDTDMRDWVEKLDDASKIVVSSDDENTQVHSTGNDDQFTPNTNEQFSYTTDIVAGVIRQKKVVLGDQSSPAKNEETVSLKSLNLSNGVSPKKLITAGKLIKEGWAVKQGHVRKNWKRRYFILTTHGFSYYKSNKDKEPIRSIGVGEIFTSKKDESSLSENRHHLFLVATTERIYYIQADSQHDMENWIKSFNDAIHISHSIKRKSKDLPGRKTTAPIHGTPEMSTPSLRKLEATVSLASSGGQRNSAYLGSSHAVPSVVNRMSCADEAFYGASARYGRLSGEKHRTKRPASSSEDSSGLGGSADSLSTAGTEHSHLLLHFQSPKVKGRNSHKGNKEYRRSCSGTELLSSNENKVSEKKLRKPFIKQGSEEITRPPFRGSFSTSNTPSPRSSGSFSSTQSVKPNKSFFLDPQVDLRPSVKPSTVKKKRNTGITFSLNNMLKKKAEKISVKKNE